MIQIHIERYVAEPKKKKIYIKGYRISQRNLDSHRSPLHQMTYCPFRDFFFSLTFNVFQLLFFLYVLRMVLESNYNFSWGQYDTSRVLRATRVSKNQTLYISFMGLFIEVSECWIFLLRFVLLGTFSGGLWYIIILQNS